jgi:hypothetical protein
MFSRGRTYDIFIINVSCIELKGDDSVAYLSERLLHVWPPWYSAEEPGQFGHSAD